MKTLATVLFILFCNSHNVTSASFIESLFGSISEIANKIFYTIKYYIQRVFSIFTSAKNGLPMAEQNITDEKTRRAFGDITMEEIIQESETEIPDLLNLKSEPTALMTTSRLAKYHGKRIESHVVITSDGYILTIHRLMKPLDELLSSNLFHPTVLLHHGLLGSSADWILLGSQKSLPYMLNKLGYDVWITNARGNYYSRGHIKRHVNSLEYWKFSWQEMGMYNLPAVVDYIRKFKKSNDTMDFIGHSMGATALLVLLSTAPRYNKYFRIGILLAPLAYMSNTEGPFRIFSPIAMNLPKNMLKFLSNGEFFSSRKLPLWIVKKYCTGSVFYCSNPLLFISGSVPRVESWNSNLAANIIYHVPAGGSRSTIMHYAYAVGTGKFQKFDHKTEFPLNKVTLPIALFSSSDDWLASVPDVVKLYFSISNPINHYIIRGKKFSHIEFVCGPEADVLIFNKVINILQHGLPYTPEIQNKV